MKHGVRTQYGKWSETPFKNHLDPYVFLIFRAIQEPCAWFASLMLSHVESVWPKMPTSGWWYTDPSEKYEFVNWDDHSQLFLEK